MTDTKQPPHPLEKIAGMTKTVTLPGSGVEVVIRKLDMEVITQDMVLSVMRGSDLLHAASAYASDVNENMGQAAAMNQVLNQAEALKAIRAGLLREGVLRPSLDELRTNTYGGKADSSDLGMGPDYSFLVKAIEEFNGEAGRDSEEEGKKAATFLE